ncbi:MAG: hypothetical protein DMF79_18280 [Acidobacteria bacterium]|nr:MAG: hypothetical protein DMF79_18280 [Acidobacteriota bacterium]
MLVVTAGLTDAEAARFLREGASGIFLKHDSPAVLVRSIRQVMDGEASVDHDILSGVLRMGAPPEEEAKAPLTERERGVLHGVLEGLANKEIASRLAISESSHAEPARPHRPRAVPRPTVRSEGSPKRGASVAASRSSGARRRSEGAKSSPSDSQCGAGVAFSGTTGSSWMGVVGTAAAAWATWPPNFSGWIRPARRAAGPCRNSRNGFG